jgi:hypothetical protein
LRAQSAICSAATTITKTITVAAGVFAPGHLGGLTWQVPFELADAVLEETRTRKRRLRKLLVRRRTSTGRLGTRHSLKQRLIYITFYA